jgi:hypothetical protein
MTRIISLCSIVALAAGLTAISGCGKSGPYEVAEIGGTVTYEGRPVANIGLIFTPEEGRPSLAITDESGKFDLFYKQDENGAQIGKHQVVFEFPPSPLDGSMPETTKPTDDIKAIMKAHGGAGSPLTVEVTESTDDFEIQLP